MDDSVSELMLGLGDKVKLFLGEAFIEVSEEYATECKRNLDNYLINFIFSEIVESSSMYSCVYNF